MKLSLVLFLVFLSFDLLAVLRLDISVVHKSGIDKGLILVNEYHVSEDVVSNQKIKLSMKNNYSLEFYAYYAPDETVYGPSAMIAVMGRVLGQEDEEIVSFYDAPIFVRLGELASFLHEDKERGLHIDLTILPSITL